MDWDEEEEFFEPQERLNKEDKVIKPKPFQLSSVHAREHVMRYGAKSRKAQLFLDQQNALHVRYYSGLAAGSQKFQKKQYHEEISHLKEYQMTGYSQCPSLVECCLRVIEFCLDYPELNCLNKEGIVNWSHLGYRIYLLRRMSGKRLTPSALASLLTCFPHQLGPWNQMLIIRQSVQLEHMILLKQVTSQHPLVGRLLRVLDFENVQSLNDDMLGYLSHLSALEILNISGTPITDDGVDKLMSPYIFSDGLCGLINLRYLALADTKVSERCLGKIRRLKSLQFIDISYTMINYSAVSNIMKLGWEWGLMPQGSKSNEMQHAEHTLLYESIAGNSGHSQRNTVLNDIWNCVFGGDFMHHSPVLNHNFEPQPYPCNGGIYRKRLRKNHKELEEGMSLKLIRLKQASIQSNPDTSKPVAKKVPVLRKDRILREANISLSTIQCPIKSRPGSETGKHSGKSKFEIFIAQNEKSSIKKKAFSQFRIESSVGASRFIKKS